ncbi:tetratricopeptide repeat-containing sensor histidine kinase [Chitinophaga nivalis]|uniref:histidine kinase n=1 Tax=Chitinophaga nivalis TaxID=2991709 RepID=A0ABT3ITC2_9BACT|nr:ATP-binding protein [Chitinophaga nivalis]MCW3463078.1 histidine kinase [Chitinophaga nivalis]MCW3487232.1 histidine kinase [Chitinophaga nivalis]
MTALCIPQQPGIRPAMLIPAPNASKVVVTDTVAASFPAVSARAPGYTRGIAGFAHRYLQAPDIPHTGYLVLNQVYQAFHMLQRWDTLAGNAAHTYRPSGNLPAATAHYLLALQQAEKAGDNLFAGAMTNYLATVFITLQDYRKAYDYAGNAYRHGSSIHSKPQMAAALISMGHCAMQLQTNQSGESYFRQAIQLGRESGDSTLILEGLIHLAQMYSRQAAPTIALATYHSAWAVAQHDPASPYLASIYLGFGQQLLQLRQYAAATRYIDQAIGLAQQQPAGEVLLQAYLAASELKAARQQYAAAFALRKTYEHLHDSLTGDVTRKNVQQLEIQYQSEKKDRDLAEKKLLLTQKDLLLQQKNLWLILFLIGLILLLVVVFVVWQRFRHRYRLQQQQLQTLEAAKALQVLEALMQGEEKERERLSRDLHDGIGGMLSAVKMHFSALRQEHTCLQENGAYLHTLHMLDNAIGEVRKTAHNLMPEVLNSMGLANALAFFCNNVSHHRQLDVRFYTDGRLQRFKAGFELSVYRIVQELVNNIIKHAHATTAIVQITQHRELLSITVEDNGRGFRQQAAEYTGMGLHHLASRITALNGTLDMTTVADQGTTVYMEFNVAVMQPLEL